MERRPAGSCPRTHPGDRGQAPWTLRAAVVVATISVALTARPATRTEVYRDVTATVTVPGAADAGVDYSVDVEGRVAGGSTPTSFELWLDATWAYDAAHRARISAGTLIDSSIFEIGDYLAAYVENHGTGTYTYTFVFGDRGSAHAWYDVAVDLATVVGPCTTPAPPRGVPLLRVTIEQLAWAPLVEATHHDVLRGSLSALRASRGDFAGCGLSCLADGLAGASLDYTDPPGEDAFFLVRGTNCAGLGSQESGDPMQLQPRDPEIAASGSDCP